jgi:hypothetical protein
LGLLYSHLQHERPYENNNHSLKKTRIDRCRGLRGDACVYSQRQCHPSSASVPACKPACKRSRWRHNGNAAGDRSRRAWFRPALLYGLIPAFETFQFLTSQSGRSLEPATFFVRTKQKHRQTAVLSRLSLSRASEAVSSDSFTSYVFLIGSWIAELSPRRFNFVRLITRKSPRH